MTHTSIEQLVLMGSEFFANLTFQLSANWQIGVVSLLMTRSIFVLGKVISIKSVDHEDKECLVG